MADRLCIDVPLVTVYSAPEHESEPSNQLLYGEEVEILNQPDRNWAHIKSTHDGYEGFVPTSSLKKHQPKTHKVSALATQLYERPDFKTPPVQPLYFLSQLSVADEKQDGFIKLSNGLWVFENHLNPIDHYEADFVETALRFVGAPYVWGGRSVAGLDCTGLVQLSLMAAGVHADRDTKDQIHNLGVRTEEMKRGALIYYERHVAIFISEHKVLNATARSMSVQVETLESIESHYGAPIVIKSIIPEVS